MSLKDKASQRSSRSTADEYWRELIGERFDALGADPEAALAALFDNDRHVRIVAISVCPFRMKLSNHERFRRAVQNIALIELDDEVRSHAISAWGASFDSTRNVTVGRLLALMVRDPRNSDRIRRAAYDALRRVHFGFELNYFSDRTRADFLDCLRKYPKYRRRTPLPKQLVMYINGVLGEWRTRIDHALVNQYALT